MPAICDSMDADPGGAPAWIVRKAADRQAIYSDTVNFSNKDFAPFAQLVGESWSSLPAETDPPMHGLYRKWINPVFTPKAMRELEEKITNYAREYCETMRPRGECEFRSEEHTSELQSLMRISYAVFCLKKKTIARSTETKSQLQSLMRTSYPVFYYKHT